MNQLEKLLLPTQTTKMVLWTVQQDQSFAKSPLFDLIATNLDITKEQTEKIQEHRGRIRDLIVQLRESLDLIKTLRTSINNRHQILDKRITSIRQIATAKQTVQLLLWISKNSERLIKFVPNFTKGSTYTPGIKFT